MLTYVLCVCALAGCSDPQHYVETEDASCLQTAVVTQSRVAKYDSNEGSCGGYSVWNLLVSCNESVQSTVTVEARWFAGTESSLILQDHGERRHWSVGFSPGAWTNTSSPSFTLREGSQSVLLHVDCDGEFRNAEISAAACSVLADPVSPNGGKTHAESGTGTNGLGLLQKRTLRGVSGVTLVVVLISTPLVLGAVLFIIFHSSSFMKDGSRSVPRRKQREYTETESALPSVMTLPGSPSLPRIVQESQRIPPMCSELAVPGHTECVLALPSFLDVPRGEQVMRPLADRTGHTLLMAGLTSKRLDGGTQSWKTEFLSLARTDQHELAFCELVVGDGVNEKSFVNFFFWDGRLHSRMEEQRMHRDSATLLPTLSGFVIESATSNRWLLRLQGNFEERKISVINAVGDIVAMVTPGDDLEMRDQGRPEERYKLRLGPEADVAVIVLAVLASDRLLLHSVTKSAPSRPTLFDIASRRSSVVERAGTESW